MSDVGTGLVESSSALPTAARLAELDFTVRGLAGTDFLGDAVRFVPGVPGARKVTKMYRRAFSDPDAAETRLTEANKLVGQSLQAEVGALAVDDASVSDGEKRRPTLLVAGVDSDGSVFGGYRVFDSRKERRTVRHTLSEMSADPRDGGVVSRLIPTRRNGRGALLDFVMLGRPTRSRPSAGKTTYDRLARLDPNVLFDVSHKGYAPTGFNYAEAMTNPATHNRMLHIARLGGALGAVAFGLRRRKSGRLFVSEPALWQSLAHLGEGTSTYPVGHPNVDQFLTSSKEQLAAVSGGGEHGLAVGEVACLVGAAALAVRNPGLRAELSAKLASLHNRARPEELARPELPQRQPKAPQGIWLSRWFSADQRAGKATNEHNEGHYQDELVAYRSAMDAYTTRQHNINNFDSIRSRLDSRGGEMLATLVDWRKAYRTKLWEKVLHGGTHNNPDEPFSMREIVAAAMDPSLLPILYDRVKAARSSESKALLVTILKNGIVKPVAVVLSALGKGSMATLRGVRSLGKIKKVRKAHRALPR